MTSKEKDLLLKDLCARLPYGVNCEVFNGKYNEDMKLSPSILSFGVENIKLYLRPMSSMTEEEKTEFVGFINWIFDCDYQANTLKELLNGNEIETDLIVELFDWLNEHHLDYRGLIPMGLALPAQEGMYKF